jgi:hypothetical protein
MVAPRMSRLAIGLAVSHIAIASPVRADDLKQACTADYEAAQERRQKGALLASRDALRSCARLTCPQVIQKDCATWLEEVERAIPSVTIVASADGVDAIEVEVKVDGVIAKKRLDGKPLDLDPGEHDFEFSHAGYPSVRMHILVAEGEQRRGIEVRFSSETKHVQTVTTRPVPSAVYALGAVSLVSAASFATFGVLALTERSHLRDSCSPFCTDDDTRSLRTKVLVADVSLAVAIASLGAATVFYVTRPSRESPRPMAIVAAPTTSGVAISLGGWF